MSARMPLVKLHLTRIKLLQMAIAFTIGCMVAISFQSINNCVKPVIITKRDNNFLIVLILSAPKNQERRNAIRETWLNLNTKFANYHTDNKKMVFIPKFKSDGFLKLESIEDQFNLLENYKEWMSSKVKFTNDPSIPTRNIKHLFVIGTNGLDIADKNAIVDEKRKHSDLLLLTDLQDSYQNLTIKLIKSLQAITEKYQFNYLLKCDDDTYIKLDLLLQDLYFYHKELKKEYNHQQIPSAVPLPLELQWGYFNGRAQIKTKGQWKETNYFLSERYLPYALGGGYVISYNLTMFVATNAMQLNHFVSEDISMGIWIAPFKNVHRRHDVRFDTGYMARQCQKYHLVLHKRTAKDMYDIYGGNLCSFESDTETNARRPKEYFYDWTQVSTKCCDIHVN